MEKVIFHCDCNSFYASVELLHHPDLLDKPVAVSGTTDHKHGIILAKNEAAKQYNVKTAEAVWEAKRKCPNLVLLAPHHREYRAYSKRINDIYANYTDLIEPFGIDESWLDMTGSWQLFATSPKEAADRVREDVYRKTGLTISVGVSYTKTFAKLASDYRKPNATTVFTKEATKKEIWPLEAARLLYVGRRTSENLQRLGIHTIGDLAQASEAALVHDLGSLGKQLHDSARGLDGDVITRKEDKEDIKSVGNGNTFRKDLVERKDVRVGVGALADEVGRRLRSHGLYAASVQVQVKDAQLRIISRQQKLPYSSNLAKDIAENAMQLIDENWDYSKPIRLITVTAQQLTDMPYATQLSLLDAETHLSSRRAKLEKSMDSIKEKYGSASILEAGALYNDIGVSDRSVLEDDK